MKGEIAKNGCLLILRDKIMAEQFCPFSQAECKCGDCCPMFGEPVYSDGKVYLALGNRNDLIFEEFEDNRE